MDKIKISEITHLMARIRALMDDEDVLSATVNNYIHGGAYVHLFETLFKRLFDQYETSEFDLDTDELSTTINGVKVFCLVDKNDRTTD